MELILSLLTSMSTSDTPVQLEMHTREQAIAVVKAYGLDRLDDAYLSCVHPNVSDDSNPYEELISFSEFKQLCV